MGAWQRSASNHVKMAVAPVRAEMYPLPCSSVPLHEPGHSSVMSRCNLFWIYLLWLNFFVKFVRTWCPGLMVTVALCGELQWWKKVFGHLMQFVIDGTVLRLRTEIWFSMRQIRLRLKNKWIEYNFRLHFPLHLQCNSNVNGLIREKTPLVNVATRWKLLQLVVDL